MLAALDWLGGHLRGTAGYIVVLCAVCSACGARSELDLASVTAVDASRDADGEVDARRDAGVDASIGRAGCFTQLASGGSSACAVREDGALYCWGNNVAGQLGFVNDRNPVTPTRVDALVDVRAVDMGGEFTCAATHAGLHCFGRNNFGQLGRLGSAPSNPRPVVDGAPTDLAALSTGGTHGCAIDTHATLYCWGNNGWGELGIGTVGTTGSPGVHQASYVALDRVTAIAAGEVHTCAVVNHTAVYCWGGRSDQPTYPSPGPSSPVFVADLPSPVVRLTAGNEFACAVGADGVARCWGAGGYGTLGDGTLSVRDAPEPIVDVGVPLVAIDGAWWHVCAVGDEGSVFCWGTNGFGELGFAPTAGDSIAPAPQRVPGIDNAIDVNVSSYASCALTDEGEVWCWGRQDFGVTGTTSATIQPTPTRVPLPCP